MKIKAALFGVMIAAASASAQDAKFMEQAASGRVKGADKAPVTVIEIADFQCPYCGRFAREVAPKIDSAYVKTGKVKWVYMNFPLPTHAHSWSAAEAAMCAGGSGRFWPMHDRIFAEQDTWSALRDPAERFAVYAREAGVPAATYEACVKNDMVASIIVRDLMQTAGAGIGGTPAFAIGNDPLFTGYRPFEEWKGLLDAALKKAAK
jgi:protein-disulfide isomerase